MYYLQSRYYDQIVGRFVNADDVDYIGYTENILSYNIFTYCENNPIKNTDAFGTSLVVKCKNKKYRRKIFKIIDKIYGFSLSVKKNKHGNYKYEVPNKLNFRQLSFKNKYGSKLIDSIVKSKKKVVITISKKVVYKTIYNNKDKAKNGKGTGSKIKIYHDSKCKTYNIDKKDKISFESCWLSIVLAHELIHALHAIKGTIDIGETTNPYVSKINKKFNTKYKTKESYEELTTIGVEGFYSKGQITENKIRKELGLQKERVTHWGEYIK